MMAKDSESLVQSELHSFGLNEELIDKNRKKDQIFHIQSSEAVSCFYLFDTVDTASSSSGSDSDCADEPLRMPKRLALTTDSTGDLILRRRPRASLGLQRHISIQHTSQPTPLADVGLQVWRGACLLCDWLLAQRGGCSQLGTLGTLILELGGGVGLVGVAAAAVCQDVVITDVHRGALTLAAENLKTNAALIEELRSNRCRRHCQQRRRLQHHNHDGGGGTDAGGDEDEDLVHVDVCELDWFDFLGYGSGSVTVEGIVRALREDAGPNSAEQGEEQRHQAGQRMAAPACEEADATQCISSPGAGLPLECAEPDPAAPCEIAKGRVSRRRPLRSHSGNSRVEVTCCGGPARVLDAVAAAETLCLIAADTVYDSVLTEAFVKCAATLLSYHSSVRGAAGTDRNRPSHHHKSPISNSCAAAPADSSNCGAGQETRARLVVSLEMRINFVVKGMTEGSPAVDDFMSYVTRDTSTPDAGIGCRLGVGVGDVDCGLSTDRRSGGSGSNVGGVSLTEGAILHAQHHGRRGTEGAGLKEPSRPTARPQQLQGAGAGAGATAELPAVSMPPLAAPSWAVEGSTRRPLFKGRRLDLTSVPQALQYERCNQLELWELTLL